MAFTDIAIAQRSTDYTNITDTSAKLVSLNRDGDAVLEISTASPNLSCRTFRCTPESL